MQYLDFMRYSPKETRYKRLKAVSPITSANRFKALQIIGVNDISPQSKTSHNPSAFHLSEVSLTFVRIISVKQFKFSLILFVIPAIKLC